MATFTDDFNRANSATLGGNWVEGAMGGSSTAEIVSNKVGVVSAGTGCPAYNTSISGSALTIDYTLTDSAASDDAAGFCIVRTANVAQGYTIEFNKNNDPDTVNVFLNRTTLIGGDTLSRDLTSGDQIRMVVMDTGSTVVFDFYAKTGAGGWDFLGQYIASGGNYHAGPYYPGLRIKYTYETIEDFNASDTGPGSVNASAETQFDKAAYAGISETSDVSIVAVPTGGIAAGNLVAVLVTINGTASHPTSITDSRGNVYTLGAQQELSAQNLVSTQVAYSVLKAPLFAGDKIIAHFSASTYHSGIIGFVSYSGVATVSILDQSNSGIDNGFPQSSPLNSGNVTTTVADEILVGFHITDASGGVRTYTPTTDWTNRFTETDVSVTHNVYVEDRIVNATGTYASTPTPSADSYWNSYILAFKAAVGPQFLKEVAVFDGTSNPTNNIAIPAAGVGQGSTVVIAITTDTENADLWTATDTQGNTYTRRVTGCSTGGSSTGIAILTGYMTTALVSGNTITLDSHSTYRSLGISVCEFMRVDENGYDTGRTDWNNSGYGTAWSTQAITTADADELLVAIAALSDGHTNTPGGSFVEIADRGVTSTGRNYAVQYAPASSAGSYAATGTRSESGITMAAVVALKSAATVTLDTVLPDADVTTTGWTTTPLFSKINDASDATVIQATAS